MRSILALRDGTEFHAAIGRREGEAHPRSPDMRLARKQQAGSILGVAVEVDNNRLVGSKQRPKRILTQRVRVCADLTQNQEVIDIDHPDPHTLFPQDSSRSNDFKRHFHSDTDQHDIRIDSIFSRVFLPDGRAGNTVPFGLFDRQPAGGGVLGTDNEGNVVSRAKAVVGGRDGRVGVGGEVDSGQVARQRDEGADEAGVLVRVA